MPVRPLQRMMVVAGLANYLNEPWILFNVVLEFVLITRLIWLGVGRRYPKLIAFLGVEAVVSGLQVFLGGTAYQRAVIFIVADLTTTILFILVLRELLSHLFAEHPAIAAFSRKVSLYLLVAGAGIAVASLMLDPVIGKEDVHWFGQYYAVMRSVYSAGLVLALAAVAMTAWFPLNLKLNVSAILSGCVLLMVIKCAGFYSANLDPGLIGIGAVARMFVHLCWTTALFWWVAHLSPAGELSMVRTGLVWDPDRAERLTAQLQGINARLDSAYSRN